MVQLYQLKTETGIRTDKKQNSTRKDRANAKSNEIVLNLIQRAHWIDQFYETREDKNDG